jgi:hypothetical protein
MNPGGTKNQEQLCWRGPATFYYLSEGRSCPTPKVVRQKNIIMSAAGHETRNEWADEAQQVFSQQTYLSESVSEVNMVVSPVEPRTNNDSWQGLAEYYPTRPNFWDRISQLKSREGEKYAHGTRLGAETKNDYAGEVQQKITGPDHIHYFSFMEIKTEIRPVI